jgi:hypothetical protein
MTVLVLGLNHQIQPAVIKGGSTDGSIEAFERSQKQSFGKLVQRLIRERGVQFVGEESKHGEETVTEQVCNGICRYCVIEMPREERERRNIPFNYNENPDLSEAEKSRYHCEREIYMCDKAMLEAAGLSSILIICGRLHSDAIACELRARGHEVEVTDVQNRGWYIEDWKDYCLNHL